MDARRNGNGPGRTRDSYAEVGRAARHSWDRAIAAGCTGQELAVLGAIHYHLATYSRLYDRVSLGTIARTAGIWRDDGDCPSWARNKVGGRMKNLVHAGAIEYLPARGPGAASLFRLPSPPDESQPVTGCLSASEKQPVSDERQPEMDASSPKDNPFQREKQPKTGAPSEEDSEDVVRGGPSEDHDGSADRRLTAPSPPADNPAGDDFVDHEWIASTIVDTLEDAFAPLDRDDPDDRATLLAACEEADLIAIHLADYLPEGLLYDLVADLADKQLRSPRRVLDIARALAHREDINLPRLEFPEGDTRP